MELPKALQQWSSGLQLFREDLQLELGDMLRQLAYLVGPLNDSREQGEVQPNGYDGIINRGHYDQLLLTEWALADELPMEFTRRAVMREHLFLKPQVEHTEGAKQCLVLFDSGTSQLGLPRLAHMALMIVLERRARNYQCDFVFGFYHQGKEGTREFTGKQSIEELLHARTLEWDSALQGKYWQQYLDQLDRMCEVWVISPRQELSAGRHRLNQVVISEQWETDSRCLHIHINKAGRQRQAVLALPSDEVATRLIRAPFATRQHQASVVNNVQVECPPKPASDIIFNQSGRRFILELNMDNLNRRIFDYQQGLAMYTVSYTNQGSKPPQPQNLFVKDQKILACTVRRRRIVSLTLEHEDLCLNQPPSGICGKIRPADCSVLRDLPLQELNQVYYEGKLTLYFTQDKCLYRLSWQDGAELQLLHENVLALHSCPEQISWFGLNHDQYLTIYRDYYEHVVCELKPRAMLLGNIAAGNLYRVDACAQNVESEWRLYDGFMPYYYREPKYHVITVPANYEVMGVVRLSKARARIGFMQALDEDSNFLLSVNGNKICLQNNRVTDFISLAVDGIKRIWVNRYVPEVIYLDQGDVLRIYSIELDRLLMEFKT